MKSLILRRTETRAFLNELGIPYEPMRKHGSVEFGSRTVSNDVMSFYQVAVVSHGSPGREGAFRRLCKIGILSRNPSLKGVRVGSRKKSPISPSNQKLREYILASATGGDCFFVPAAQLMMKTARGSSGNFYLSCKFPAAFLIAFDNTQELHQTGKYDPQSWVKLPKAPSSLPKFCLLLYGQPPNIPIAAAKSLTDKY